MTRELLATDLAEIRQTLSLFSHVFDNGDADALDLVFTQDVVVRNTIGRGYELVGIEAAREFTRRFTVGTVDHQTLDTVVLVDDEGTVRTRSRYLGLLADGSIHGGDYYDVLVRTDAGWRISYRLSSSRIPKLERIEVEPGLLDPWTPRSGQSPATLV
jgi:SnoaL-like domain